MTGVHSPVLIPSKFRPKSAGPIPSGVKDIEAYEELVANYTTLKAKVNKLLAARVDSIRHSSIVDLTRNYIGAIGLQAITSLLAKNDKLQELILPGSGLNNDSVVFFCRAMVRHPLLSNLDFSCNTISLAAGLAIVSLLQQNNNIIKLNLSETQIPDAVMKKIEQCLDRNRTLPHKSIAANVKAASTIMQSVDSEIYSTNIRQTVRKIEWNLQEQEALQRLEEITKNEVTSNNKFVPAPHPDSGWRVIEVAILAPPFLFESEMQILVNNVFPRLNEELVSRKVFLVPPVDPPSEPAGVYLKNLRFAIAADVLRSVAKSRLLTIELIGDRAGDYEQLSANEMVKRPQLLQSIRKQKQELEDDLINSIPADSIASQPLKPVLHTAHEKSISLTSWSIIAARKDTRRIGIPPSLAPLLTEEPPVEHPDHLQLQIRQTVTVGSDIACGTQKIHCDAAVKEKKWREHQKFRENVLNTAPIQELVIRNYNATFDHCSEDGQVYLKNLEEFAEAIYKRMRIILLAHFSPCNDSYPTLFQSYNMEEFAMRKLHLIQERLNMFLISCVENSLAKKSITNRLDMYIIAPPSRNAFLLYGAEPVAVTSLIGAFTSKLISKEPQKHRIAFHTTRSPLLTEEPTDLREIICNIILQLFQNSEVYRRAIKEVDIIRLQQIFADILTEKLKSKETFNNYINKSTNGSSGNDNNLTVIILDGLDCILPIIEPCKALRTSDETGKDIWGTPPLNQEQQQQQQDPFSYIPQCLSRNVRLVLGCEVNSSLHHRLESRGRDSVELLSMGPMTPNDFDEMLRPAVMSKFGVTISDDDFVLIRKKEEALSPEYIALVVDALRGFNEEPGVETQAILASLPGTVKGMVQRVYYNLRKSFGSAVIRKCTRLLISSRWGIYEPQLRAMLQLPQRRFNQLLRMMRPLLEHSTPPNLGIEGGNSLHLRICITSHVFRKILEDEDLQEEGSENDYKIWNGILANCYLNVVHGVVEREKTPPLFGLQSTSPYERMAVKELTYHAIKSDAYHILHRFILSMTFLMLVYRNSLGYHLVRELIVGFNTLYELFELGEYKYDDDFMGSISASGSKTVSTTALKTEVTFNEKPLSLLRLRDYIYFLREYNAKLTEFPHLVLQSAIESSLKFHFVASDAREFITRRMSLHAPLPQRRIVFFEIIDSSRAKKPHHKTVTSCIFAPKGKRITTGSIDRSVCTVSPATGAVSVQARHAPTMVENILYCETGAYHAAVCHDRTLLIYDSAQMKLVSRCDGGMFGAPLTSVAFSARGRFYLVATEDLHVRVFETEKSLLMLHVDQRKFLRQGEENEFMNVRHGYASVIPHRTEDEIFYTTCHNIITMWQLTPTRDEFLQEMDFEVSFNIQSGKSFLSGTHILLHPAPLPTPADGRRAAPRQIRLYSITNQSETAILTSSGSQIMYHLSNNEKLVASALDDGSVVVHQLLWTQLLQNKEDIMMITPFIHFKAFCNSPVPTVKSLRFRANDKGLFVLGNNCEMKFWVLPRRLIQSNEENNINSTGTDNNNNNNSTEYENSDILLEEEQQEEDEIFEGIADGEFVLGADEATAWDVAPVLPDGNAAEVVFGDASGKLTMLRMWSPIM